MNLLESHLSHAAEHLAAAVALLVPGSMARAPLGAAMHQLGRAEGYLGIDGERTTPLPACPPSLPACQLRVEVRFPCPCRSEDAARACGTQPFYPPDAEEGEP